ncbi:putative redox-active protein [Desulfosporosinus acididurans]|uniref:Putative redox-active protein n=1 Tax=Desulfosporosinus acididurans TaxID=476652 RepID=A0A0J1FT84_9FIRM|nr:C-GCAxxG-C-C family protein [Desulfosporosinus acididurans]KLU66502.1 putative redox-active protein [Desulfosporosinus acididurans]
MKGSDKAVAMMKNGFLCSQAVFFTLGEQLGMERSQAIKLATGFGAGVSGMGEICGAVSGGIMALGLKHGNDENTVFDPGNKTFPLVQELIERIKVKHGCYTCKGLTGIDFTSEGSKLFKEQNIAEKICFNVIRDVVDTVEDLW